MHKDARGHGYCFKDKLTNSLCFNMGYKTVARLILVFIESSQ